MTDGGPIEVAPIRDDRAFDHGGISRFNAWFFTAFARYINHLARPHKAAAFEGLSDATTVVEIGAGTGANVKFLTPGTHLYAVEPSLAMHAKLRDTCEEAGVSLTVLPTGAEALPLPDACVDEVICSLVLCTVHDPDAALREIRRVLRPGGRFRFVEHVAAPKRGPRSLTQRVITRPWGWLFEGCDPHRDTLANLEQAGFADLVHERRKFRHSLFWPVNTALWGVATR